MKKNKKIPLRMCVGCREMKPKRELVRIVKSDDVISIDPTGKKNGRGAYICKDIACLEKVRKSKGLEKTFQQAVSEKMYELLLEQINSY